ncbi:quinolinate synthase NadA, partial [Porphyromonas sp. CAG:1061]
MEAIIKEINRLKKEKNAIILGHYYARPEVQRVADYLGDSLGLSRVAGETDADIILFCGVEFMAETASIISPDKKVLIPVKGAGCTLAQSITA